MAGIGDSQKKSLQNYSTFSKVMASLQNGKYANWGI